LLRLRAIPTLQEGVKRRVSLSILVVLIGLDPVFKQLHDAICRRPGRKSLHGFVHKAERKLLAGVVDHVRVDHAAAIEQKLNSCCILFSAG
jgi:hypothetical protein